MESSWSPGRTDPDLVILHHGWTHLACGPDGWIGGHLLHGYHSAGTQLISGYAVRVDERELRPSLAVAHSPTRWSALYPIPDSFEEGDLPPGTHPRGSLELRVNRALEPVWVETLTFRNHDASARRVRVDLGIQAPVQPSIFWVEGLPRLRFEQDFGRRRRAPTRELRRLLGERAPVDGEPVIRAATLEIATSKAVEFLDGATHLIVEIGPRETIEVVLRFVPEVDGRVGGRSLPPATEHTEIVTADGTVNLMLAHASEDLESLRLPVVGREDSQGALDGLIGGIPRYVGLFSRDALTTAWQASLLSPEPMLRVIARLSFYAGVHLDPWRDEEPDRLPHELRMDGPSTAGETNREIYYGDVVATPFWIFTLAWAFHWTGDHALLIRHAGALEACCRWVERRLQEGGGFLYYQSVSEEGNRHQGWKDSGDGIVDAQGRLVAPPLATVELQGYVFLALLAGAELSLVLGHVRRAMELFRRATDLRRRFNEAFWMPESRYFAVALDREGRRVESITSNVGHALGCGIIPKDRVPPVVERLMSPDLFSGWGIRTLSSGNPAYDPWTYHRGSVWPVENATIAAAMRLCGFDEPAHRILEAQLSAATRLPMLRLPEVMTGHARPDLFGLYHSANLLQAWSVSAVPFAIHVLLGLRPLSQLHTLFVKPSLPEWLPWIEVRNLRIGHATLSVRFWRDHRGRTRWKVLQQKGRILVVEQPAELSPSATLWRRIRDAVRSAV